MQPDDRSSGSHVSVGSDDPATRIRERLDAGAPWDACDAFREAIAQRPNDGEILYWGALAHARAGAVRAALAILDRADAAIPPNSPRRVDVLSLRGRLWKDAFERATEPAAARAVGERARNEYLRAFAIAGDPYPGINAATVSMLLGDREEAARLAADVARRLEQRQVALDAWDLATLGEADLLMSRFVAAHDHYMAAYRLAAGSGGVIATMRRQLKLLARVVPSVDSLLVRLRAPDVVAFAGHMVDQPGRASPRFPASLETMVASALRSELSRLHNPIVYTSAACGADLLMLEAALETGVEANIVLPFDRADFVRSSVVVGGDGWVGRFEAVMQRATRVIMATEEGYLGDNALFEHAALLVDGLTMVRAAQLQTEPTLLCVLDQGDATRVGGTRATVERWTRTGTAPVIIDLHALRAKVPAQRADVPALASPACPSRSSSAGRASRDEAVPAPALQAERPSRTLKTMLFADFAGYSRLHDAFVPLFQQRFLEIAASLIKETAIPVLEAKTWGDALYAVFDSAREGAEFALRFLERMQDVDWTAAGLAESSHVRIALHSGAVFRAYDPVMHTESHFGSAVVRAARIEPVTPPGMVYASEAFAATLAATRQRDYLLEYIGTLPLAKGYGDSRLYRLDRCRYP